MHVCVYVILNGFGGGGLERYSVGIFVMYGEGIVCVIKRIRYLL